MSWNTDDMDAQILDLQTALEDRDAQIQTLRARVAELERDYAALQAEAAQHIDGGYLSGVVVDPLEYAYQALESNRKACEAKDD